MIQLLLDVELDDKYFEIAEVDIMDKWVNPFEKFLPSKTYAELVASNPIIPKGYIQIVEDIQDGKIGDGITSFNSLPFFRINLVNGGSLIHTEL